jgi:hypothetical protein
VSQGHDKLEAVRLAKGRLGDVPPAEIAAYVEANFGLILKPAIVAVLLASLLEREQLEASKKRALRAAQ